MRVGWRHRPLAACSVMLLGGLLAACAGDKADKPVPNVFPADFKDQIILQMPKVYNDPTNIRDAFYSEPVPDPADPSKPYRSCVRFNPRDSNRQYLGSQDYIAYYFGGKLNQFYPASALCANAPYKPFPELEKICLGNKCS